jgi:hypothetical protein
VRNEEQARQVSRPAQAQHFGKLSILGIPHGTGPIADWLSPQSHGKLWTPYGRSSKTRSHMWQRSCGDSQEIRHRSNAKSVRDVVSGMGRDPHESFRSPADLHDRFCCCCLLTNRCLCLPLASRTSGDDWSGQTTIFLDVATRASIEANGLEAILRYIWTNVGIRSGLLQQIRRSRQEGHAHLRTEWP